MRVFVDMDGVLADFDTGYFQRFGKRPSITDDSVDWDLVRNVGDFYAELPLMQDAHWLIRSLVGILGVNPTVLTGVPQSVPGAAEQKQAWLKRHLGDYPIITCASKDKCLHGQPGDVLIDDWEKYRHLWVGMGGVWITHRSALSSAVRLASHMRELEERSAHSHISQR